MHFSCVQAQLHFSELDMIIVPELNQLIKLNELNLVKSVESFAFKTCIEHKCHLYHYYQ